MLFRRNYLDLPFLPGVRRAERRDLGAIVELWLRLMQLHREVDRRFELVANASQVMTQRFQGLLNDPDALILVSHEDGQIVGFLVGQIDVNLPFFPGATMGFVSDLYVVDGYRREGRGERMVEVLRSWFRMRGVSSIQLHAAACNPVAHEFWKKMGFEDYLMRMWSDV